MRCPQCGYHSYADLRRCKKCGVLLAALELPALAQPVGATKQAPRAAGDIADIGVKESQHVLISPTKLPYTGEKPPEKAKPFPEFLLERGRQPSFFDQAPASDTVSSVSECAEPAQNRAGRHSLLPRRVAATLIDLVVLGEIWYAFVVIGAWGVGQPCAAFMPYVATQVALRSGYYLIAITTMLSYFTLFHSYHGQTIGKFLFRVQVVALDETPVTVAQALMRSAAGALALLCVGFGYLIALFDTQQRGWNDRLAGTRVVVIDDGSSDTCGAHGEDDCEIC